jgi:hypothetical protein
MVEMAILTHSRITSWFAQENWCHSRITSWFRQGRLAKTPEHGLMTAVARDRLHHLSDEQIAGIHAFLVARSKLGIVSTTVRIASRPCEFVTFVAGRRADHAHHAIVALCPRDA